jgi:hypothetical protein
MASLLISSFRGSSPRTSHDCSSLLGLLHTAAARKDSCSTPRRCLMMPRRLGGSTRGAGPRASGAGGRNRLRIRFTSTRRLQPYLLVRHSFHCMTRCGCRRQAGHSLTVTVADTHTVTSRSEQAG